MKDEYIVHKQISVHWTGTSLGEDVNLQDQRMIHAKHTTGVQTLRVPPMEKWQRAIRIELSLNTGPPVAMIITADKRVVCEPGGTVEPGRAFVYVAPIERAVICPDGIRKLVVTSEHNEEAVVQFEILWNDPPKDRKRR